MDILGLVNKATKTVLDINQVSIDNWAFKVYYKVAVLIIVLSSLMVTSSQLFGGPIKCDAGAVSVSLVCAHIYFLKTQLDMLTELQSV